MDISITLDTYGIERSLGEIDLTKFLGFTVPKIALKIERESKLVTPVRTGRLRSSIHTTILSPTSAVIGPDVNYAVYVHEGTKYMSARPFMTWGVEEVLRNYGSTLEEGVAKEVEGFIGEEIEVYRGEGRKQINPLKYPGGSYGPGKYYADTIAAAKQYGTVTAKKVSTSGSLIIGSKSALESTTINMIGEGFDNIADYARFKGFNSIYDTVAGVYVEL